MTRKEKIAAIGSIMGTEMKTGSGGMSQYAKMLELTGSGVSVDQYLDLREADAVDGYLKYRSTGVPVSITPEVYIDFRRELPRYDADGNGSFTQAEVRAAIDGISEQVKYVRIGGSGPLSTEQKAVLWQMYNKSWSPKNNPYSISVGRQVYDALHEEQADDEPRYLAAP